MESMDLLNETQDSCSEYSVYSPAPSEVDVELVSCVIALSSFDLNDVAESLKTGYVSDEELDVVTALSYSHDLKFLDDLESGELSIASPSPSEVSVELTKIDASENIDNEDYSVYSIAPSEVDVKLDENDNADTPEKDVLTALAIDADGPEVGTAISIADVATAMSFLDQGSVYTPKPSTTNVEVEGDLIGEASSPVLTAVSGSSSWYQSPPSEADCELPFTFKLGNATVVDSIEAMHLGHVELKPVQFIGAKNYLYGAESAQAEIDMTASSEANIILAHNATSCITASDFDDHEVFAQEDRSIMFPQ